MRLRRSSGQHEWMQRLSDSALLLARRQANLLTRARLAMFGFSSDFIARRLRIRHWQLVSSRVVALQGSPLTRLQRIGAASLHFENHVLTGVAALEVSGLGSLSSGRIDLLGPRGGRVEPFGSAVLHTSRRMITRIDGFPAKTSHEISVLHAVAWAETDKQARFFALWAVQRRLVELESLYRVAASSPADLNFRRAVRLLAPLEPGVTTLTELEFLRQCRRRGLPEPKRQVEVVGSDGRRRFLDFVFEVKGATLIVEIDGRGHLEPGQHVDDIHRDNSFAATSSRIVRVPAYELFGNCDRYFRSITTALAAMAA